MASRRVKGTNNNTYTQSLKIGICKPLILTSGVDYNSLLFTKKHKACPPNEVDITLWAKFASDTFDGIHLIAFLEKDNFLLTPGSCTFNIYRVNTDSSWTETFLYSTTGSLSGKKMIASATQANLGATADLDGELTLAVEALISRAGKSFKRKVYVNHLGVYDSIFRLRQDVEFLDITKVDE